MKLTACSQHCMGCLTKQESMNINATAETCSSSPSQGVAEQQVRPITRSGLQLIENFGNRGLQLADM